MTTVSFAELSEQHSAEHYDHVSVTLADRPNEADKPVWQRPPSGSSLDPTKPMPVMRMLHVIASESDNIEEWLTSVGYDDDGLY